MRLCPDVQREAGLDMIAVDRMRATTILRIALQTFGSAKHPSNKHAFALRDQARLRFDSDVPLPLQVDGELIGERTTVEVRSVPDALSIVA